jgi:hypothetical protein
MNGKYIVSTGGQGPTTGFNDDFASKGHQFFDVWAPEIATHYGEVFWTDQGALPIPADIVSKFDGKVMAITGYEQDQVMVTPTGHPGVNPSLDVSVPINWAYNHHYSTTVTGAHSYMQPVPNQATYGERLVLDAFEKPSAMHRSDPSIPTSQWFSEGNGGESRKSFHGYPSGFAQLIDSPDAWHITPMQIDTRNRECGVEPTDVKNCTDRFYPGPESKSARYGRGIPADGTNYSGVIECPCTDNWAGSREIYGAATRTKQQHHDYKAKATEQCGNDSAVATAAECFDAVTLINVFQTSANATVSSATLPSGCSIMVDAVGTASAIFNSLTSSGATCNSVGNVYTGEATSAIGVTFSVALDMSEPPSAMRRRGKGAYCSENGVGVLGFYTMANVTAAAAVDALTQCEVSCVERRECRACSVVCPLGSAGKCSWVAIMRCGTIGTWDGIIAGDVSLKPAGRATLTMTGPATKWFAVGINATNSLMTDAPYTIIVNDTGVAEQKIGTCGEEAEHCAGRPLETTLVVLFHSVVNGLRTVVMTRDMSGATSDHYTFLPAEQSTIRLLTAVGNGFAFGYHAGHMPITLTLTSRNGNNTCVCDDGKITQMCDQNGQHCAQFVKACVAAPDGSLVEQANPTCNSGTYSGGLSCCSHGRILLDSAQERRPELLRYHMKFRFWYEEYNVTNRTPSHRNLQRLYWQTEANAGEYDVPPAFAKLGFPIAGYPNWPIDTPTPGTTCTGACPNGYDCECVHTIHYMWKTEPMRIIYAGGHCHAPSCISIELFRNDTGEIICRQSPIYGTGTTDKWDQAGYLTLPPCLWGDDSGLLPSVLIPAGVELLSIKKNRNTFVGHYGEMASWQMRGVST